MDDRVRDFVAKFQEVVDDCRRFCYAARAREFQVDAIAQLEVLKDRARDVKAEMVALEDEDSTNCLLSLEESLRAFINELRMWVALKDDDPNAAWDALVEAQTAAGTAIQVHDIASHLGDYVERLRALEKLLFPPQTFVSPGIIIQRSTCTICGQEYGDCNHLKGKPYMGQICARKIEEAVILERSIVEEAANKHSRMIAFSDGGVVRDIMTWRVISDFSQLQIPE